MIRCIFCGLKKHLKHRNIKFILIFKIFVKFVGIVKIRYYVCNDIYTLKIIIMNYRTNTVKALLLIS
jgi:hypothetical protein